MSRRLVRAKQKIREAGIPFRVPPAAALQERLAAVLRVIYLVFNQGYNGDPGLRVEAIDLVRLLNDLVPAEPEVEGLLALMLLQHARSLSRVTADGTLVPLEEQDRSVWDHDTIAVAVTLVDSALASGRPGPYQLQAAIAACHATATSFDDTDWHQISGLYELLTDLTPSPVIELNRVVATAMAGDLTTALRDLDTLAPALDGYYLVPATRADLLRRLSRFTEARDDYRIVAQLAPSGPERKFLLRRLTEIS